MKKVVFLMKWAIHEFIRKSRLKLWCTVSLSFAEYFFVPSAVSELFMFLVYLIVSVM